MTRLGDHLRFPTPKGKLFAWHTNALLGIYGDEITVFNEEPECGFFKTRMVKGGPFVPARIWMVQPVDESGELIADEVMQAEINGKFATPERVWQQACGNSISEQEWRYLPATITWAIEFAPDEPQANLKKPVDWFRASPPILKEGN